MSRFATFALIVLGLGLVAAGHGYLWIRLVRDAGLSESIVRTSAWILGAFAVSIPAAVVTSRLVPPRWSRWWVTPVYLWLGTAFLLALSSIAVDLVHAALALATPVLDPPGPAPDRARAGAVAALVVGLAASVWAAREGRRVRVERVDVRLDRLPAELDGLRIVQISDLHVGPTVDRQFVEHVVTTVNDLAPDLVAITGDLVDASVDDLERDVASLATLRSTWGTWFVTGNHEYHAGADRWCAHLGRLGIRVLSNERVELKRDGHAIDLAGIVDPEAACLGLGPAPDLGRAVAGRDTSRPLILLAHRPGAIHEAVRHGVDLQLSGHTHGGQLWPMGWLLRLGQPIVAGLAKVGDTVVYVSRGTGHSGPPMRLGARAEITELVLRATARAEAAPARGAEAAGAPRDRVAGRAARR
jgi:predicted MPP superfamily phosphohydrolase